MNPVQIPKPSTRCAAIIGKCFKLNSLVLLGIEVISDMFSQHLLIPQLEIAALEVSLGYVMRGEIMRMRIVQRLQFGVTIITFPIDIAHDGRFRCIVDSIAVNRQHFVQFQSDSCFES